MDGGWLTELEGDLKHKVARNDCMDVLEKSINSDDPDIRVRVVWCIAKLAQNKYDDERIMSILIPLCDDTDDEIRENAVWGIGEAFSERYDERCPDVLLGLLDDGSRMVRGMAAWACGRMMHKQNVNNEYIVDKLNELLEDDSDYVRRTADFALNG